MKSANLKNWKGVIAVIGVDWGDSGKGRLVDDLSHQANIVARYNGGSNTGHTVKNQFGEFALHITPSGIFNKKAKCLIGRNVAVDLPVLISEIKALTDAKVSVANLVIDEQAPLTLTYHKLRDGLREKQRAGGQKLGTTNRGIGPTYADQVERVALRVKDLYEDFGQKLSDEIKFQNQIYNLKLDSAKIYEEYSGYAEQIKAYVGQTLPILQTSIESGKNVLFEGAQGYFLDVDAGTYPFVTSSNSGVVGIWRSFDLHPENISKVVGITKAYTTRVGEGPMPTKIEGKEAEIISTEGREFGTTTGRARRPGWLDLVLIKYAVRVNKLTSLAITKLDVLSKLAKINVCVGYQIGSRQAEYLGHDADHLAKVKRVYEELAGWHTDITDVRNFADLPKEAQKFIRFIEEFCKVPVGFISVGPERGQVIYK